MHLFQSCIHLFNLILFFSFYHFYINAENLICKTWENQNGCLSKIDECLIWSNGGKLFIKSSTSHKIQVYEFNSDSNNLIDVKGSCINDTNEISLTYKDKNYVISLNIFLKNGIMESNWIMDKMILNLKDDKEFQYEMDTRFINAPKEFSYSCSELFLSPKINTTNDEVELTIYRFQIQPFSSNNTVFTDSFDCSTWFSLPMWMGLIGVLLFTISCAIGIYYLMDIKTMDRFENPKSKPLTIAVSE